MTKALARKIAATEEVEGRWAKRRAQLSAGVISGPGLRSSVHCMVRDVSSTGAKLQVGADTDGSAAAHLPPQFKLFVRYDFVEVDCEIVWRKGTEIGVRFLGATRMVKSPAKKRPVAAKPANDGILGRVKRVFKGKKA